MRFTLHDLASFFATTVETISAHPFIAVPLLFAGAAAAWPFGRVGYRYLAAWADLAEINKAKAQFELTERRSAKRAKDAAAREAKGGSTSTRALPPPKRGQTMAIAASTPQKAGPEAMPEERPAE